VLDVSGPAWLLFAFGQGTKMSAPPQETTMRKSLARVLYAAGCVLFLTLALKVGVESFRARSAAAAMRNWKGGSMAYRDGFKLTAVLVVFAGCFFYVAVRPSGNQ
jgi:hypothetical protein